MAFCAIFFGEGHTPFGKTFPKSPCDLPQIILRPSPQAHDTFPGTSAELASY